MSNVKSDAIRLSRALSLKALQGRRLLIDNPSMESAVHFREVINAHLHHVRYDLNTPAMEALTSPEEIVKASLEGLDTLLKGLKFLFRKRSSEATTKADKNKAEAQAKWYEEQSKFLKVMTDKNWLAKAEYREGSVPLSATSAAMFFRGGKPITSVQEMIAEFTKDLNEYLGIFSKLSGPTKTYMKWATETWKKTEDFWEAHQDDSDFVEQMTELLKAQVKKRPTPPIETVSLPKGNRLGFQNDDWNPTQDGSEWFISEVPDSGSAINMATLSAEGANKLADLYLKIIDALTRVYDLEHDFIDGIDGFDDYPWRTDEMIKALWDLNREDGRVATFDLHYAYDSVLPPFTALGERLEAMADAVFDYMHAAIVSRP